MILLMIATYFHDLAVAMLAANILTVYFLGKWLDKSAVIDQDTRGQSN